MPRGPSHEIHTALLRAAGRLFYERGIGTTGVETVAEAAGTGKAALYRHFDSKVGLIEATLAKRDVDRRRSLAELLEQLPANPVERLEAAVAWQLNWVGDERFRGCGFVRAAAELEAGGQAAANRAYAHKTWYRNELGRLAVEAGAADPARLAVSLALVLEGATTLAFLGDRDLMIERARQLTQRLISQACQP
ncbi:MAG: TetR/AcrR family transcriptional regulator [Solirubrobacteraceae bacterium]